MEIGRLIAGMKVGHHTAAGGATGVTVVVPDRPADVICDIRGGGPATRELAKLEPGRPNPKVDAIVISGGSAFGLSTADGVMRAMATAGRGYPTADVPVPIIPTVCLYDLALLERDGDGLPKYPTGADGARALAAATATPAWGRVGAGAGATVGKYAGPQYRKHAGVACVHMTVGDYELGAIAVVNALGDIFDADGSLIAGVPVDVRDAFVAPFAVAGEATTLVVVMTTAPLDPQASYLAAVAAHDGMARAVRPVHTLYDGDLAFVLRTREIPAAAEPDVSVRDRIIAGSADVVAAAIREAARQPDGCR